MRQNKNLKFYSQGERVSIIKEYLESDLTLMEVAKKHKISNGSVISNWMRSLQIQGKYVTLHRQTKLSEEMKQKPNEDPEALKARIKELEAQLNWSKLQNMALEELISVAESQGMPVRKKAGAKR